MDKMEFSSLVRMDYKERVKKSDALLFVIHKQRRYAWAYLKVNDYFTSREDNEEFYVPTEFEGVPVTKFVFCGYTRLCKMARIFIPACITRFYCESIWFEHNLGFDFDKDNPKYFSDGKAVYTKDGSRLLWFTARADAEFVIRSDCRNISTAAFKNAINLKNIRFPAKLEKIESEAFLNCRKLRSVTFPEGLTEIGSHAFESTLSLKRIELPSTLKTIGEYAFYFNKNKFDVRLPAGLEHIGRDAFPKTCRLIADENGTHLIPYGIFIISRDRKRLEYTSRWTWSGVLEIPEFIEEITTSAFGENLFAKKVILPAGLHTIRTDAFREATKLEEINLENVKVIEDHAFSCCNRLKSVSVNCNIGAGSFSACTSLTDVTADCENIDEYAFMHCHRLKNVTLKNTVKIGESAFEETESLKKLELPETLNSIGKYAFFKSRIRKLTIPAGVREIGRLCAEEVKAIGIYDNMKADSISNINFSRRRHDIIVLSAETGQIKYVIPVFGAETHSNYGRSVKKQILSAFNGCEVDFEKYDDIFTKIEGFEVQRFRAGRLRLKYGYKLGAETRKMYVEIVNELGEFVIKDCIGCNELDEVMYPEIYDYLSRETVMKLVDYSAECGQTELTAFLLEICGGKRAEDDIFSL